MPGKGLAVLHRYLEQKLPYVINRKIRPLPFNGMVLPTQKDLALGARELVVEISDGRADAVVATGDNDDVPMAQVSVSEDRYPTVQVLSGFRYTIDELDTFALASRNGQVMTNIPNRRAELAVEAIEEKMHLIGAYGLPDKGLNGLLTSDYERVNTAYDPHTGGFADLVDWMVNSYSKVRRQSKLVEKANYLLLTEALAVKLASTRNLGDSSITAAQAFRESVADMGFRGYYVLNELEAAELEAYGVTNPGDDLDMMLFYNLDPRTIFRKCSARKNYPPEHRRMGYDNFIAQYSTGAVLNYTASGCFVEYPKAPAT